MRAIKVDPSMTYLQVRFPPEDLAGSVAKMAAAFPGETIQHMEVMRSEGRVGLAGLTMVKYTTEERLYEIIRYHEDNGCMIFNPHRYTLEEGGRQSTDDRQLAFKREADPKGLLNPGKMIAFDDPNWGYEKMYDYPGMRPAAAAE